MASKQTYPCFACKKAGFENVMVLLDGKTADGKTIYKNPDMTVHIHKSNNDSSTVRREKPQTGYDKSVDNGISTFSMMTNLILLVEQTQKYLVTMNEKLDRLLNLAEIRK